MNARVMPPSHAGTTPSFQMRSMGAATGAALAFAITNVELSLARAAVCGQNPSRPAGKRNEHPTSESDFAFFAARFGASALSTAHVPQGRMPPALEIYHVPPEGRGAGRFVARLEAVGASGPDEDGEPSDEVYVAYELDSLKRIVLFHTWTPSALRGKGLAARVCEEAFAWADANDVRVVPECSYVSDTFLAKRKDLERLVDR